MKAEKQKQSVSATSPGSDIAQLRQQYDCGPVELTGNADALYERHLVFDNVMEETTIGARERFEAIARSVRDVLSQRWVRTEKTYDRENAKRVYYLSMEFLIGRSLANNATNLLLDEYTKVEVKLNCSFEIVGGILQAVPGRPSILIGVPFDRPVVGHGGKTINTLRLWAAAAHDYFDFKEFSSGDFVGALAQTLNAESLTRVLYPDDSTTQGQGLRFVQEYFLVACSLADLVRRFRRTNSDWSALPEKVVVQLNDTHPAIAVPELMRILLDEAHLGWDQAWDLTHDNQPEIRAALDLIFSDH